MADDDRLNQFAAMVSRMRSAQRIYFATHGGLDECKKIERAVDRWLKEYSESQAGQAKLF